MSHLNIDRLKITILTNEETFGTDINFTDGLNIIRAENTTGKSSCLNSILYALGFEVIIQGKKGNKNLVPALKSAINIDEDTKRNVLESFVELEISNHRNEKITIKRFIVSENDHRLVLLDKGHRLSNDEEDHPREKFYLHDPGSASNPRGFHKFLEDFLGWDTPKVPTYDGSEIKLYMECLIPLHFVEQKRGWSMIQATTPTIYGIRDPKKQATEYLLDMEAAENYRLKQELSYQKNRLSNKWDSIIDEIESIASYVDSIPKKLPESPVVEIEEEPVLLIEENEENWVKLDDHIINLRETIQYQKGQIEPDVTEAKEKKEKISQEIDELEEELFLLDMSYRKSKEELIAEKREKEKLKRRLSTIEDEIKSNQDAIKIKKFAVDHESKVAEETCPTCLQKISSSLLDPKSTGSRSPMSIEDNIEYLKQQKSAIDSLISQTENAIEAKEISVEKKRDKISDLRTEIKDLKKEIIQDDRIPSEADLRKLVRMENDLKSYENTRTKFNEKHEELVSLAESYKRLRAKEEDLPSDLLSARDKEKLSNLKIATKKLLHSFGFKSTHISEVGISPENYRPTAEGIELAFDTSASDGIRLIWSYMLAIQYLSNKYNLRHLGISFFDEPGQQEIEREDYQSFFESASSFKNENQVIVTTSEDKDKVKSMVEEIDCNLINYDSEYIFTPAFN